MQGQGHTPLPDYLTHPDGLQAVNAPLAHQCCTGRGACSTWVERLDLMKHTAHAHVHCNYHKLVKVCILLHQRPK